MVFFYIFSFFGFSLGKDPCADVKCLNGGSCKKLEDGNFNCVCMSDYTGEYCEHGK